jgi:hypothetical protein
MYRYIEEAKKAEVAMAAQRRRLDRREAELNTRSAAGGLQAVSPMEEHADADVAGGDGQLSSPFMPVMKAMSPRWGGVVRVECTWP